MAKASDVPEIYSLSEQTHRLLAGGAIHNPMHHKYAAEQGHAHFRCARNKVH